MLARVDQDARQLCQGEKKLWFFSFFFFLSPTRKKEKKTHASLKKKKCQATYAALASTYGFLSPDLWPKTRFTKPPLQEFTDLLAKPAVAGGGRRGDRDDAPEPDFY